jgi:FkbM family methyltransferase
MLAGLRKATARDVRDTRPPDVSRLHDPAAPIAELNPSGQVNGKCSYGMRRNVSYATFQDRLYDSLAQSTAARRAALRVRNIATQVLAHRLAPTIDPDRNGEALLQLELAYGLRVVIDVGANRGEWTAHLLRAAPAVERVICYEPACAALELLKRRFRSDGRVEIVAAAVADAADERVLFEEPDAGETSSLVDSHTSGLAHPRPVRVVTLDDELGRLGIEHVDLLKIDAEGMDLHVLRGAERMLRNGQIAVAQFEYGAAWAAAGSTLHAAFQMLRQLGYEVLALLPDGLYLYEPQRTGELFVYSNFVALSPEVVSPFRQKVYLSAL